MRAYSLLWLGDGSNGTNDQFLAAWLFLTFKSTPLRLARPLELYGVWTQTWITALHDFSMPSFPRLSYNMCLQNSLHGSHQVVSFALGSHQAQRIVAMHCRGNPQTFTLHTSHSPIPYGIGMPEWCTVGLGASHRPTAMIHHSTTAAFVTSFVPTLVLIEMNLGAWGGSTWWTPFSGILAL